MTKKIQDVSRVIRENRQAQEVTKAVRRTSNPLDIPAIGLLMTFVFVSIAYSTYVVYFGTIGTVPKLMLIPQAAFGALLFLYKFIRK